MSNKVETTKKLKVVSLLPKIMLVGRGEGDSESEEVIIAPVLIDGDEVIEDLGDLIETVYKEFSQVCEKNHLDWTAELEMGLQFGLKFNAKLKISPKQEKVN
jgi:hypothetical protein